MPEPQPSLLFVSIENSSPSPMAKGFARQLGRAVCRDFRDPLEALMTGLVADATRSVPAREQRHD